jgi:type IV pilus assembly protein PilW
MTDQFKVLISPRKRGRWTHVDCGAVRRPQWQRRRRKFECTVAARNGLHHSMPPHHADYRRALVVLARDDHYHKPSTAGGPCEATTAANRPTWAGGAFLTFDAPGALPSCYRYRVFETVVPLRNMIWRPE